MTKLRVAVVAPSLQILRGQAIHADGLIDAWRNDAHLDVWFVPVNPVPPRGLRFSAERKYLRTCVNGMTYLPLLVRELAHADVIGA